jgi:Membrane bound O-acyl transferase family
VCGWLVWIPSCLGFACGLGLLASGSVARRRLAVVLGAFGLGAPYFVDPAAPVLRAAVALDLLWVWLKAIDLARDARTWPVRFRITHMLVIYDLRRDESQRLGRRPELRLDLLSSAVASGVLAWLALHVALFTSAQLPAPERWLLRHGAGLLFAYLGVEAALRGFELIYRGVGLRPPGLHDHPILSRSVAEFWGRRWNRVVGRWLFATVYRPLIARGEKRLGLLATFAASALLHFHFTYAAVGLRPGLTMAAFFVLQVPLLWLEKRWGERHWPSPLRRLWTLGWFFLASPLFLWPLLDLLAGGFGSLRGPS